MLALIFELLYHQSPPGATQRFKFKQYSMISESFPRKHLFIIRAGILCALVLSTFGFLLTSRPWIVISIEVS